MASGKLDLLDLSYADLEQLLTGWGQPRFRAMQVWRWLYNALSARPEEMANLPKALRQRLAEETYVGGLVSIASNVAEDGLAEKVLLQMADGQATEAVLMHYTERNTVCVSSQIGCAVGCTFCATGQQGFARNLTAGEIIAQILLFARRLRAHGGHVTHVVFMGMGEPMLNFDAVWRAIRALNHPEGLALGWRRFTISTAGVIPGIERLAHEGQEVGLAVSLHAADDVTRNSLLPIGRRYPLGKLIPAVKLYVERLGRRVTFEYVLLKGVNDGDEQARRTVALLQGLLCHVNLIPLNPTPGCSHEPSLPERVSRFQEILLKGHIQATVRLRRGLDIQAGCGQLRGRYLG